MLLVLLSNLGRDCRSCLAGPVSKSELIMRLQFHPATALAILTTLALTPSPALSQQYPARPVQIFVGTTAGGAVDIIARALAETLGPRSAATSLSSTRRDATTPSPPPRSRAPGPMATHSGSTRRDRSCSTCTPARAFHSSFARSISCASSSNCRWPSRYPPIPGSRR